MHNAEREDALRMYYTGIPEILHVHESVFVAADLCVFIETEMAFAQ